MKKWPYRHRLEQKQNATDKPFLFVNLAFQNKQSRLLDNSKLSETQVLAAPGT